MLFQSVFIGKFYLYKKTNNFKTSFASFYDKCNKGIITDDNIGNYMNAFEENSNAKIALINPYKIILAPNDSYNNDQSITFENSENTIISAYNIFAKDKSYFKVMLQNSTVLLKANNQLIGVAPLLKDGKPQNIILATTSLQPVGEVSAAMREFYIYFYILALALIFVLSTFFSKMITNPLKKLNSTAVKMSKLDFTEKCNVSSNDELGNLASTLNFLSDNLGKSLSELQSANDQLKEDIEKEKQLEKMRKEFVAGVSHELKTPIALISGYAEGIKDGIAVGEEQDYYLDVIMDESKKMTRLVSDMLDLSQLESGNFKLNMEPFYIDELVNSVIKRHNTLIEEKNIKTELRLADENIEVNGDCFRIEQVIINFLNNATKYTPKGGKIYISVVNEENQVRIGIENEGDHIPEDELPNIWEKFYKVEKSRNRVVGGTGLGLSIVKNILLLHNSEFGVLNTEKGVLFYFTMNIIKE